MNEKQEFYSIPDEILHLLTLKVTGNIQDSDAQKLEQWLRDNPDAQDECAAYADRIRKIHWIYLFQNIAKPQQALDNVFPSKTNKSFRIGRLYRYMSYAAAVLLFAGLALYFLHTRFSQDVEMELAIEEPALERHNRAVLVLSDGASLALNETGSAETLDEKGVRITNRPGELLRYEKEGAVSAEPRMNRLIVPAGARYQLQLADGTRVWMNAQSELEYPVAFAANSRNVKLTGEAYFEVMEDKSAPFIIEANGYEIAVLGTSLNISAYADDDFIQTTLVTGALEVNSRAGSVYKLNPGQMAMINHEKQEVIIEEVNTRLFTSWREGILHFNKITLKELAVRLERWYDVEIHFAGDQTQELLFSGAMENSRDIRFLLNLIGQAANVEFEINENKILVK